MDTMPRRVLPKSEEQVEAVMKGKESLMRRRLVRIRVIDDIIKLLIVFSLVGLPIVAFSSCSSAQTIVDPSGNKTTEVRDLESFNSVELTVRGTLVIEQGDKDSITIETYKNLMPLVTTNVSSGKLTIGVKEGYQVGASEGDLDFRLMAKDLNSISNSSLGSITASGLHTEGLEIDLSSYGAVIIDNLVVEGNLVINSSGFGDMTTDNLVVTEGLQINSNRIGGVTIQNLVAKEITTEITDLGIVSLSGKADKQTIISRGVGVYEAEGLESTECTVEINATTFHTDSPECRVSLNVSDSLDVRLNGDVDVCYKGNPQVTEEVSGNGSVKRIE